MEKLIVIAIIVVASVIHSWIKRKQEEPEEQGQNPQLPQRRPPPIPPAQQAPKPSASWEEDLRRLLGGETVGAPRPRPPIPRSPPKPPAPPPVIRVQPEAAAPRPFLARSSIPVPEAGREMEVGLAVRPVSLDQATAAHQRAAHLQASVVQRMQETTSKVTTHAALALAARRATNADRMRTLLRQRESQRTIMLASAILGPPKGIDP